MKPNKYSVCARLVESKSVYGSGDEEVICNWSVDTSTMYDEFTTYKLTVETGNSLNFFSLYTLTIQNRVDDVEIQLVSDSQVTIMESEDMGENETTLSQNHKPIKIPRCAPGNGHGKAPAKAGLVWFVRFDSPGKSNKFEFVIKSYRTNCRSKHNGCSEGPLSSHDHDHDHESENVILFHHDNLPPQPGSGGNN